MTQKASKKQISVAPMMDWTDRHCRYFHRLISPHTRLYTEMVTTGALIHGDKERFLRFDSAEHPVALQLGGSDPQDLATCTKMGEDFGYDEINLNCGCPSDRVQSGQFGACLMNTPDIVAAAMEAMKKAVSVPVTVKCRIGVDDCDEDSFLPHFIETVHRKSGCDIFIIHARKAWLEGLSPKENRTVPSLRYDLVQSMKAAFPDLTIILNGGLKTIADIQTHSGTLDGAMIGREAYQNPYFLAAIEKDIFGTDDLMPEEDVVRAMIPYIEKQQKDFETPLKSVTKHMHGLFQGRRGAKKWRQILSTAHAHDNAANFLNMALSAISEG